MAQELFECQADVLDDLAEEHWRNISPRMVWDSRAATVGVPILHVRATLPCEGEAQRLQDTADLARFENGRLGHELCSYGDALSADKLRLQNWFAVLQEHLNDLSEITLKLVKRLALRVRAREAGNEADIKPGIGTTLNDCGKCFHGFEDRMVLLPSQCARERLERGGDGAFARTAAGRISVLPLRGAGPTPSSVQNPAGSGAQRDCDGAARNQNPTQPCQGRNLCRNNLHLYLQPRRGGIFGYAAPDGAWGFIGDMVLQRCRTYGAVNCI